jgi:hypothetical protein
MNNCLMEITDKLMLMRRSYVETIFSSIKSLNTLIYHRHRCPINAFAHLFQGLSTINFVLINLLRAIIKTCSLNAARVNYRSKTLQLVNLPTNTAPDLLFSHLTGSSFIEISIITFISSSKLPDILI